MKNKKEKTPSSAIKRANREKFYKRLSSQRKYLSKEIKDLKVLDTLKQGFKDEPDFELSDIDRRALEKHNQFMESQTSSKINEIHSDIRLNAAITRGNK